MADVVTQVEGRSLKLSNLDKVLYPSGFTKGEVIEYYHGIAPVMLPHLAGRPVTRVRWSRSVQAATVPTVGQSSDWISPRPP